MSVKDTPQPPCYGRQVTSKEKAHPDSLGIQCERDQQDVYREALLQFAKYHWGEGHFHLETERNEILPSEKWHVIRWFDIQGYKCRNEKNLGMSEKRQPVVPTSDMLKLWKFLDEELRKYAKIRHTEPHYNIPFEAQRPWEHRSTKQIE